LVSNQCTVGLSDSVGLFVLGRRYGTEVAVEALGVVPVHPRQGGEFDVVDGAPGTRGGAADQLGLVEADHGLGQGVVVGIPDRADRGHRAQLGEALPPGHRGELAAGVGVDREPIDGTGRPDPPGLLYPALTNRREDRST